jgi:hypothetical protein
MSEPPKIFLDSILARALREYFQKLEARLQLKAPIQVWVAGGMAVNLYTGHRPTNDIDAEFSRRVIIPNDIIVEVSREGEALDRIWFDHNYNPMFALMHEDYQVDAIPVDLGVDDLQIFVLSPSDLILSKIARFSDVDQDDIRALARLVDERAIERRAREALAAYPGSTAMIEYNLRDALAIIREAREQRVAGTSPDDESSVGAG